MPIPLRLGGAGDARALDVDGRTWSYQQFAELVRDKKIASFSEGLTGYPGIKYPHLFAFLAVPLPGHKADEKMAGLPVRNPLALLLYLVSGMGLEPMTC